MRLNGDRPSLSNTCFCSRMHDWCNKGESGGEGRGMSHNSRKAVLTVLFQHDPGSGQRVSEGHDCPDPDMTTLPVVTAFVSSRRGRCYRSRTILVT